MSQVLGKDISEDLVHSLLLCKKCFKLFDEVDKLEQRLIEIKLELVGNYQKSILKNKNGEENIEDDKTNEENITTEQNGSNKENEVPKKILDIPSSDDDTQVLFLYLIFRADGLRQTVTHDCFIKILSLHFNTTNHYHQPFCLLPKSEKRQT